MSNYRLYLTSFSHSGQAQDFARSLIQMKLAACASLIPQVISFYQWKDALEEEQECLLLIKTSLEKREALLAHIKAHHPYETPELIEVTADLPLEDYRRWFDGTIKQ